MIGSASKVETLMICAGSAALPTVATSSAEARAGTESHRVELPPWAAGKASGTPLGRKLSSVELPADVGVEVSFALDPSGAGTARRLAETGHRDYSAVQPDEIAMTADLAAAGFAGELKTGAVWVDPPARNAQILTVALAVWFVWGKLPDGLLVQAGTPLRVARHSFTARQLLDHQRALQAMVASVQANRERAANGDPLDLRVGDHCGYCPALLTCPAVSLALGPDIGATFASASATMAKAKQHIRLAQVAAHDEPLALPDGFQLERSARLSRVFDHSAVAEVLAATFGAQAAARLATMTYRAGDLDEFAETRPDLGTSKVARKRALMQILGDAGAMHREPQIGFRVKPTNKDKS